MANDADKARKRYDPGEHRFKHCGSQPQAGFRRNGSAWIGLCPSTLSKEYAEELLNAGIAYPEGSDTPQRIYNVHEGVVYEAVYSGGSWHGYPWRYRPGRKALPRQIRSNLERRATDQGYQQAFKNWMKEHGR